VNDGEKALKKRGVDVSDKEGIDLILRMIAIDPAKRITIAEIKKHPWMKKDVATQEELLAFYYETVART